MLTDSEMQERIKILWSAMTDLDWEINFIRIREPNNQDGYSVELSSRVRLGVSDGYYLYKKDLKPSGFIYVFSYSERGYENIIIKSENFKDLEYEIAYCMAEYINSFLLRNEKKYIKKCEKEYKYKGTIDFHMQCKMLRGLLKKTTPEIHQKIIEKEMYLVLKNLWSAMMRKRLKLKENITDKDIGTYFEKAFGKKAAALMGGGVPTEFIDESLDENELYLKELCEQEIKQFNFIHIEKPADGTDDGYFLYSEDLNNEDGLVFIFSDFKKDIEEIITRSKDIEDIEYEMAWRIADHLIELLFKKQGNDKETNWKLCWEIRLDLLEKATPEIYQKEKSKYEQEMIKRKEKIE